MITLLRHLHSWIGFFLAVIIILVSLTGSALVWKKEYLWLTMPEVRDVEKITPELAANIVSNATQLFPEHDIILIRFGLHNLGLHKVWLGGYEYAYLDDDGKLLDRWYLNERIEELIYDFHHRLLLEDLGLLIAGLSALVILLSLPLGLILWWPQRRSLSWRIFHWGLKRPQLLMTHKNLGVLMFLPVVLALLTGIVMSFPSEAEAVLVSPFNQTDEYNLLYEKNLDGISGVGTGSYQNALKRAQDSFPDAVIREIRPASGVSEDHVIALQKPNDWNQHGQNKVWINSDYGDMFLRLDGDELPAGERFMIVSYPLHTGITDSMLHRIFITIAGLSLAFLAGLGFLSFSKKLKLKFS